jgi:hypothetical protein
MESQVKLPIGKGNVWSNVRPFSLLPVGVEHLPRKPIKLALRAFYHSMLLFGALRRTVCAEVLYLLVVRPF